MKVTANGTVMPFEVEEIAATDVAFTPTGTIAATTVAAALAELDSEKTTAAAAASAAAALYQPKFVAAPAAANSTGTAGSIAFDATHIYVCVETDTWVRADLATWGG